MAIAKGQVLTIILAVALVLSLAFGGTIILGLVSDKFDFADAFVDWLGIGGSTQGWGGLNVDVKSGEYITPVIGQTSQPGVAIPGWGTITVSADNVYVPFYNPEANSGKYALTFELLIPKDGAYESIYVSNLTLPGNYVPQPIVLTSPLSKGSQYEALIHVQPYRIVYNEGIEDIEMVDYGNKSQVTYSATSNSADVRTTFIVR